MTDGFDPNRVVADFVRANLDDFLSLAATGVRGGRDAIRVRLKSTYEPYIRRLIDQYSKGKSFFSRTEPIPLYEFFVPLDLSTQRVKLARATIADVANVANHAIVMGTGGSGKTMLMRHFLMGAVQHPIKTPLFVELRQLNRADEDLRSTLLATLKLHGLDIDDDYFERTLVAGHFLILLDGFDELDLDLRQPIAVQIQELATRYPRDWIVISSRPDIELNVFTDFTQFAIEPLEIETAVDLVDKVRPFDEAIKARFVEDLRSGLFDEHRSFLSNPLLLSIMLLTYSGVAHIPNKLSLFYQHAYEALFLRHDAFKGFQRDRRTTLDLQDFARAFSAFCVLSYHDRAFEFTRASALGYLDRAKGLSSVDYESSAFLDDALQAVCLLIDDGLNVVFTHRSFQEYFVATFVNAVSNGDAKKRLLQKLAGNVGRDSVMTLLHEMDPTSVEQEYVLPLIQEVKRKANLQSPVTPDQKLALLTYLFEAVRCLDGQGTLAMIESPDTTDPGSAPTETRVRMIEGLLFVARTFDAFERQPSDLEGQDDQELCAEIAALSVGRDTMRFADITASDPVFDAIQRQVLFGGSFPERLLEIEAGILERHGQESASLEELLTSNTSD